MASLEKVAKKWIDSYNKKKLEPLLALYATNCRNAQPHLPPVKGRAAMEELFGAFFRAFPDGKMKMSKLVVKGDTMAMEWAFSGSHQAPLTVPAGTIPATNRKVVVKGAEFTRHNAKGQIVDERGYFDVAAFLAQLGVSAPPAGSGQPQA